MVDKERYKGNSLHTIPQALALMKVLHCLSLEDFTDMVEWMQYADEHYVVESYRKMKTDMFSWLVSLGSEEQGIVFKYADKKAVWYKLKQKTS